MGQPLLRRTGAWPVHTPSRTPARDGHCPSQRRAARPPGGVAVAQVAAHACGRRESALESDSFATFVDHDVELPGCNVWLDERTRTDFLWRRHRVAGEADGKIKYVRPWQPQETVLWSEKLRQERIEDLGFVVRWTAAELRRSPDVVLARIRRGSRHAQALYGVPLLRI